MLRVWHLPPAAPPKDDSLEALAAFAQTGKMAAETLSLALAQLITIDLPAFTLMDTDSKTLWVALVAVNGENLQVAADGEPFTVPRAEFRAHFANQAVVFWRDPEPYTPVLRAGVDGRPVSEFQRHLRAIGRFSGEATGIYDQQTSDAVARLQVETGLTVDGRAGKQVRMVLASWVRDGKSPSLQGLPPLTPPAEAKKAPEKPLVVPEPPKADPSKAEAAKAESPKPEPAKAAEPTAETPKVEPPIPEPPKAEPPKAEEPKVEAPKPEPANPEASAEAKPTASTTAEPKAAASPVNVSVVDVPAAGTLAAVDRVIEEDIAAPMRETGLRPVRLDAFKEVTPPATGNVPLIPMENASPAKVRQSSKNGKNS